MPEISDTPKCGGGIKTRAMAETALRKADINAVAIERILNRLPVWATLIISILTFTLGFLSSCLMLALRFPLVKKTVQVIAEMLDYYC